jgi:hypothetical protein
MLLLDTVNKTKKKITKKNLYKKIRSIKIVYSKPLKAYKTHNSNKLIM